MAFLFSLEFWLLGGTWLIMYLIVKEHGRALNAMRARIEYLEQHALPRDRA